MSYDVSLVDDRGQQLHSDTPHDIIGGTYAVGGTTELWLNITSNYGPTLRRVIGGIDEIDGKRAGDTIPLLVLGIGRLGDDTHPNYWEETDGNVKAALRGLLELACKRPDGTWSVRK